MSTRLACLVVPMLAAGLIAAGCGDDDETTTSSTSVPAAGTTGAGGSDVVAQAEAICQSVDKEINPIFGEAFQDLEQGEEPSQAQFEEVTPQIVPIINSGLDEMRALPGAEDDPGVSAFIEAADQGVSTIEDDPAAFAQGNPFKAADQAAKEAGMKDCVD